MTIVGVMKNLLERPPLTGKLALLCAFAAVAFPTIIRIVVDSDVRGVAFSPYIPFVLLAAVVLGWAYAAVVATVSAAIADILFVNPRFAALAGPTDVFGIAVFLASVALIAIVVEAARIVAQARRRPAPSRDGTTGIIFSLEGDHAWASWSGSGGPIRLGPQHEVAEMMQDFLRQLELGERLNGASRYRKVGEVADR